MPFEIVAAQSPEQIASYIAPVWHYFGGAPKPQDFDRFVPFVEPSRAFSALEDGAVVGGCASFPFEYSVPGGTVRAAGVSVVGVLPTHRRRGILRQLMRAQLDDAHRRGEPVAVLWASEDTIYGQFGYGMASLSGDMDLPKPATAFARPGSTRGALRLVDDAGALEAFPRVYDRVRRETPGMLARTADWWRHRRLADPEHRRGGGGALNRVLLSYDGEPAGYALYRIHQQMDGGISSGFVQVIEAVGVDAEATRDIWRCVLDVDWVARVKAMLLPMDHPLFFLLARPRELRLRIHDGLWVRLLDLPKALAARKLGAAEPVVFEVADAFCPWNAGRWRVGAGGAERTSADAEIACDVTALGSVYLGGFSASQLARAGRVEVRRPEALPRADALFAWDRAPWCPEIF